MGNHKGETAKFLPGSKSKLFNEKIKEEK